jgi:hypothetical protein
MAVHNFVGDSFRGGKIISSYLVISLTFFSQKKLLGWLFTMEEELDGVKPSMEGLV